MPTIPYQAARPNIRSGDVLLFRRACRPLSWLSAAWGRSIYSHAAVTAWWGQSLFLLHTEQWHGGEIMLLSRAVQRWPGRIDVFRPLGLVHPQRAKIVEHVKRATGQRYGWRSIARHAWHATPLVRWLVEPPMSDMANGDGGNAVCSELIARAYRVAGGVDLVPHLSDWATTPGDLARSARLERWCTLTQGGEL